MQNFLDQEYLISYFISNVLLLSLSLLRRNGIDDRMQISIYILLNILLSPGQMKRIRLQSKYRCSVCV